MKRSEKEQLVSELNEITQNASGLYFVDFTGVTVSEINDIRREFFKTNIKYVVAKNTLIRKAFEGNEHFESIKSILKKPTAIAISDEDYIAPAKIIKKNSKNNKFSVKLCIIENQVYDASRFNEIASLPSRNEAIASILGSMNAPIANLVYVLDAYEKKLQEAQTN